MLKNKAAPFDVIAHEYDDVFSRSMIGRYQRGITRKYLQQFLSGKVGLRILEINCGTGEDALWLASLGHDVIATDQSRRMISIAQQKVFTGLQNNKPKFMICDFEELDTMFEAHQFDLIFSNFSGLNCVSEIQLSQLNIHLHALLKNNGHLAAVIFGKYSCWETIYYLSKADISKAFRRWHSKKMLARLSDNIIQSVYYYSISKFIRLFNEFSLVDRRPVGLFIPPSYLETYFQKHVSSFNRLAKFEKKFGDLRIFSSLADHVYILLKKVEQ